MPEKETTHLSDPGFGFVEKKGCELESMRVVKSMFDPIQGLGDLSKNFSRFVIHT